MILPTIHLNGTHKDTLIEDYSNVSYALLQAETVLVNNGPNARDYYVQGPGAFTLAQAEHVNRVLKLREILTEIDQIVEHIDKQER